MNNLRISNATWYTQQESIFGQWVVLQWNSFFKTFLYLETL